MGVARMTVTSWTGKTANLEVQRQVDEERGSKKIKFIGHTIRHNRFISNVDSQTRQGEVDLGRSFWELRYSQEDGVHK